MGKAFTVIVCSAIFLAAGLAAGAFAMTFLGYRFHAPSESEQVAQYGGPTKNEPTDGESKQGGRPGKRFGGGGKGKRGAKASDSKAQLDNLIAKLDTLAGKPLKINLTEEQARKVVDQVRQIEKEDPLSDKAAKEHLDALLEILQSHKDVLKASGLRLESNSQSSGDLEVHLKSLEEKLSK